jgi:hypothetical protein
MTDKERAISILRAYGFEIELSSYEEIYVKLKWQGKIIYENDDWNSDIYGDFPPSRPMYDHPPAPGTLGYNRERLNAATNLLSGGDINALRTAAALMNNQGAKPLKEFVYHVPRELVEACPHYDCYNQGTCQVEIGVKVGPCKVVS